MGRPITVDKAAEITGISIAALRKKASRGDLPYYLPLGGGKIMFDFDELCSILLSNRVETNNERQEKASQILMSMNRKRKAQ